MATVRRHALWIAAAIGASTFAAWPTLVSAQLTVPAGDYDTRSILAGFNYSTPDFSTGFDVFVQVDTKISDPRVGPSTSSHTETVFVDFLQDGFGQQGCYDLAPGQFAFDSRLGSASLHAAITADTPTCGDANIPTPFQVDMTLTRSGPIRSSRSQTRADCLDYSSDATNSESLAGADASAGLTPLLVGPVAAPGVLRISDEQSRVRGTVHETCPEEPGAIAGGAGPPNPGQYLNSRSDANISKFDESGQFALDLEDNTDESRPVGGPAVIDHRMQVRFSIQDPNFNFVFGCFVVSPSDFSFNGAQGAELNVTFTDATPTCFGEPAGIPLPQTLHATWATTSPISTFRFRGSFACLSYHLASQGSEAAAHPSATATLTPYLTDPVTASGSQTSLTTSDSRAEAGGKKQAACRI
jgi:hypothetical protein